MGTVVFGIPWYDAGLRVSDLTDKTVAPDLKVSEPEAAIRKDEPVGFTLDEWTLIDHPELDLERDCGD